VHAIRGISFVVNHGDVIGVIGRNGSGKSTLLRAIAGLLPAEQGAVYTSGQPALLGVNAALLDDLTGERNVVLGCLAMGMPPQEVKARFQDIVDFSGVGKFVDLPMRAYSTGMAQRLRFAIASAKSHEILMIDEALATGDAAFRTKSHNRIKELRNEGARSSSSPTTSARSSRAATGSSGWKRARSCAIATTSRASLTSTLPPPAARPATASRPACSVCRGLDACRWLGTELS
jgi:ABC-type polysaccharide/polyol phosphate transport system ATPase subunit